MRRNELFPEPLSPITSRPPRRRTTARSLRPALPEKASDRFLKEASSALDEENERFLYEKLRASGIAFVSLGHRSTLEEYHDRLLLPKNDGTSSIVPMLWNRRHRGKEDSPAAVPS